MDNMLRKALCKHRRLRDQVENVLLGEDSEKWETELKKFIAKRPCWVDEKSYNGLSKAFTLFLDFGVIKAPNNYNHTTCLASFKERNGSMFRYYSCDIVDPNFPNPTRIMKPGDQFWVRAFRQIEPMSAGTVSKKRLKFLDTLEAVHTGAQGLSLVFEQRRDRLKKGFWYSSLDNKRSLWRDTTGCYEMPRIGAALDGNFDFNCVAFDHVFDGTDDVFLCFCEFN